MLSVLFDIILKVYEIYKFKEKYIFDYNSAENY